MSTLELEKTEETPYVLLDKENGKFSIEGMSLPEDPIEVFEPIIEWIQKYSETPNPNTTFDFKLSYINSMSIKQIFNILLILHQKIEGANVNWYFEKNDTLIKEKGEEFNSILANLQFNLIEI